MTTQEHPSPALSTCAPERAVSAVRIEKICIYAILILGLLQAFNARFQLNSDGVSYLDVGDYWLKGDVANAVNGYWNPIYPIIVSAVCKMVSPINEPLAAHFANFGLLVLNLWLFKGLLRVIRSFSISHCGESIANEELFTLFGYVLFAWTHFALMDLVNLTPDLLVMSSVIAAAILLFRMLQQEDWRLAAGLGAILAFAYLTKAIMFVAAPFFVLAALFCARTVGKGVKYALVAAAVFAGLSAPYVVLLSQQQGRLTYSESGKLAYSWMVNQTQPWFHWQGREPGSGTPLHPTRQLLANPDVFEFGDRPGTYPPWFDPSYWNQGLRVQIDTKKQLSAINQGLIVYYSIFLGQAASIVFLVLFGIGLCRKIFREHRGLLKVWPLLIPSVAVCGLYTLVLVMDRYVAPFILFSYSALLIGCWPEVSRLLPRRALVVMAACAIIPIVLTIGAQTIKANLFKRSELTEQRRVAIALAQLGLKPGDRIAILGRACNNPFARLGRFKIIAEGFRTDDEIPLWAKHPDFELKAVEALKTTRPKAIIRDTPPAFESRLNWKAIANTRYAALMPE